MKAIFSALFSLMLIALMVLPQDVQAQAPRKNLRYEVLQRDTLAASQNATFTASYDFTDQYVLHWQSEVANISGTTAATLTLETSACPAGDDDCDIWNTAATWTINSNSLDTVITFNPLPGQRIRGRYATTGTTQSIDLQHAIFFYRKEE